MHKKNNIALMHVIGYYIYMSMIFNKPGTRRDIVIAYQFRSIKTTEIKSESDQVKCPARLIR